MSYSTYANRGKPLEGFIEFANKIYRRRGIAMVEKQYVEMLPIRNGYGQVVNCKIGEKSTVDYIGRVGSHPIAMEAKNTNQYTIRWDAVQPHQADYLDEFTQQPGTIGLVLVSFNLEHFFAVPWAFWGAAYDLRVRQGDRKTSKRVNAFGEQWDIPTKKSARIEDLSPVWRISGKDPTFGLNYLQKAEKYVISI